MSVETTYAPAPVDQAPPEDDEYVGDWVGDEPGWLLEQGQKLGTLDDKPPPEDDELEEGDEWVDPNPPLTEAEIAEHVAAGYKLPSVHGYYARPPPERAPVDAGYGLARVAERGPTNNGQSPPSIGADFWTQRVSLEHIRQAAHSRMCSADAVLHVVLTRIAADIPHSIFLPAIVRVRSPLCYYCALIGPPGGGKTGSAGVGAELLPVSDTTLDGLPIGSGEGFADILFERVTEPNADGKPMAVKRQTRHNAYWYIDEGQVLDELGHRSGNTILGTLRSAWSGAVLGNTNADPDKRRKVPAGTYTFGVAIGFQPTKAAQLLADGAGGTPQRFVWASTTDPHIPDMQPAWPGALEWQRPAGPTGHEVRRYFAVSDDVVAEIRAANLARTRGECAPPDELDAHRLLLRLRIAALLSLLESPTLAVSPEDWHLAGVVMDTSDAVRATIIEATNREAQRREDASNERSARRAVVVEERTREWHVVEAARAIWRKVTGDGTTVREAQQKLSREQRTVFEEALEHAISEEWVTEHEEPGRGTARRVLRPGPERLR
jgi:hypothetical protein